MMANETLDEYLTLESTLGANCTDWWLSSINRTSSDLTDDISSASNSTYFDREENPSYFSRDYRVVGTFFQGLILLVGVLGNLLVVMVTRSAFERLKSEGVWRANAFPNFAPSFPNLVTPWTSNYGAHLGRVSNALDAFAHQLLPGQFGCRWLRRAHRFRAQRDPFLLRHRQPMDLGAHRLRRLRFPSEFR